MACEQVSKVMPTLAWPSRSLSPGTRSERYGSETVRGGNRRAPGQAVLLTKVNRCLAEGRARLYRLAEASGLRS
jgi:hypothetical protein